MDYTLPKNLPVKGVKFMRIDFYVQEHPEGQKCQVVFMEPAHCCEDGPGLREYIGHAVDALAVGLETRTEEERQVLRAELREFMKTAPVEQWDSPNEDGNA